MSYKKLKEMMKCNSPKPSTRPGKKRMVKACEGGEEKLVHYGDDEYSSNYSDEARKNFRARHNCDEPGSKLKARYWACQNLWKKSSTKIKGK
jgi:hypothetical protein